MQYVATCFSFVSMVFCEETLLTMNTINKIFKDKEYLTLLVLIILSLLTALVEHIGFVFSHSNTLNIGVGHMLLHSGFFISALVLTLIQRGDIQTSVKNLDKKIYYLSIGLVIVFLGYRFYEMVHHSIEMVINPNPIIFRITTGIAFVLIGIQSYLLHARKFTCSILCHGALGHLLIDVFGFMTLFGFSFAGKGVFMIADFVIFWVTGGLIIVSIIGKPIINWFGKRFNQ